MTMATQGHSTIKGEALGGDEEIAEAAGTGEVGGDARVVVDGGGAAADVGEQQEDLALGWQYDV